MTASSGSLRPGDASPSFAQTTAEFSLDSDLDLDDHDYDPDVDAGASSSREAGPAGGETFDMKHMGQQQQWGSGRVQDDEDHHQEDDDDDTGWSRPGSTLASTPGRRGSISTVASFQLYTPDEEQAVIRKFDMRLVLFMALLYMLSFLDRSSMLFPSLVGFARAQKLMALPSSFRHWECACCWHGRRPPVRPSSR